MEMSQIAIVASEGVVLTALTHLENGKIEAAVACFADEFTFNDHGTGLEFKNRERLAEFFHKTRELYPDSSLQTDTIFVSGEHVITEWTLKTTITDLSTVDFHERFPSRCTEHPSYA